MNESLFFEDDVRQAVAVLQGGGVILYPTDTIWGIGCKANDTRAISRIYTIKQRYEKKNLIILVDSEEMLRRYVTEVPAVASELIHTYSKPLTIVYPKAQNLPSILVANDQSIAIRVVKHPFCIEVIRRIDAPLVSSSANLSGEPAPASYSSITDQIKQAVDYISTTDRDKLYKPAASTLIRILPDDNFETLRD
ncbi:MAG TPA: L-threonylcarbamoyladenylate synthase [Bacteroidales bacterium]|nr:threonylcarbamoyl-AMP synthase [Bacteroidales bacterium]MDI9574046.1 L-threonylcarbamoyladenylate synthase [Bacteroidota bacterium]OQC58923.1 MAG: Threonylcarbamoyl-AMP synthase [Bacteroidetes bacterium ADurb.Bin012]MBP9512503.1 threonylcarbamoyl-AMP synthase [Bacteroidales bacterium]MBP9588992.1 threonylcarbamoyl-AMP synthase [Bacteroidales bacterium]